MNDKKYLIIPASEVKKVDFSSILEHSPDTLSYSGDKKRTFIKWVGETPDFISKINNGEGPYNQEEILEIIRSDDWISSSKKKTTKKVT